jgi:DNA-binding LytR/AlgR family response regulator
MSEAPAPRVRVVVADDEPLARQRLLMLLALEDWVEVVAECHDGPSTKAAIETLRPDLMFLGRADARCVGFRGDRDDQA